MMKRILSTCSLSVGPDNHVYLIDGSSFIFRAYHALPPLTRKSDGIPVGAVSGFCNMLWKLLSDMQADMLPSHLGIIFDTSGDTFRNAIYPAYKANRSVLPNDLISQFSLIRAAVNAFSLPAIEQMGFEADDLIATYAEQAVARGAHVSIVSSDKDMMQLVSDRVVMLDTMKNSIINADDVVKKFGVMPDRVVDVQALAGDTTDNVPGVPGIGIKTATKLINEFGTLDMVLSRANEVKRPKLRENLIVFAEQARMSRRLVTLDRNVPVDTSLDALVLCERDPVRLLSFLKAMEFSAMVKRVGSVSGVDVTHIPPDPCFMVSLSVAGASHDLDKHIQDVSKPYVGRSMSSTVHDMVESRQQAGILIDRDAYECVTTVDMLRLWVESAFRTGVIALNTETTSLNPVSSDLLGISLSTTPGMACYIPLAGQISEEMNFDNNQPPHQISLDNAIALLKPVLESPYVLKIGHNIKNDIVVLMRYGVEIITIDDTMLISHVLHSGKHGHSLDELSKLYLDHELISFRNVECAGKTRCNFQISSLGEATLYAAEKADITLHLYRKLKPLLPYERVTTVYETLERPMIKTLVKMERVGIRIDSHVLTSLSCEFARKLERLEAELELLAGESFNPGSPKRVGEIIFGKLGLPGAKKTKSGAWATGADILERLAMQGHEFPSRLLEWRKIAKLKSTYADALINHIDSRTQRVHTSYASAGTITGRLSSSNPNLQNIPSRTEEGLRIRAAFVAMPEHQLIRADYNQIELRVLAHMADVPELRKAFKEGVDIHAMTASEVFGMPITNVDHLARQRAKAINFGILYGMSAFGLSNHLAISREEAAFYISSYFKRFPGIEGYMEEVKTFCRKYGFVQTMFGRKIHYPDISTGNARMRAFLERAAINATIQGSAADIILRSMVRMDAALAVTGVSARMLMQVHDELVFEVSDSDVEKTIETVRHVLESAIDPVLQLRVPLVVVVKTADNWAATH